MPKNVIRFEQLMYLSLGFGVISSVLNHARMQNLANTFASYGGLAIVLMLMILNLMVLILLIWLIARRRKNWARWAYLGLFLIALPQSIPQLADMIHRAPFFGFLSAFQLSMQLAALYLVFTGSSKSWFKKSSQEHTSS